MDKSVKSAAIIAAVTAIVLFFGPVALKYISKINPEIMGYICAALGFIGTIGAFELAKKSGYMKAIGLVMAVPFLIVMISGIGMLAGMFSSVKAIAMLQSIVS